MNERVYDDLVKRLLADPDNEITEPEFNLTGTIDVWFTISDGKITSVELRLQSLEADLDRDMAFARESGTSDDGPDLDDAEISAVFESAVDAERLRVYSEDLKIETTD